MPDDAITHFTIMTEPCLFFQDVVVTTASSQQESDNEELSLAFFELANVNLVGYRIVEAQMQKPSSAKKSTEIVVQQDTSACGQHTGGIVWETAYLLLNFLLSRRKKLGNVLEVGAGCGMLGQVLAASGWARKVVLTETDKVMENLLENIKRNPTKKVLGVQLDWNHVERHAKNASLKPHSFDAIVGTDVIFTPSLVKPLLQTLQYMSHENTVVYLCLQVRCPDSHALFLETASQYDWEIQDVSSELASIPDCAWGLQMECFLLRMSKIGEEAKTSTTSVECKEKKRKSSTNINDTKRRKNR